MSLDRALQAMTVPQNLRVKWLGEADYESVFKAMQAFTRKRNAQTLDEVWFVEHPAVFTLGLNSKQEHILNTGDIPIIQADRGGQVTYHGPGQLVMYVLFDLERLGVGVQRLVHHLEAMVIDWLASHGIAAKARSDAPRVYVNGDKLASLGLRVKRGCCYHGLSLNVAMDVEPFTRINPCGLLDVSVCQLSDLIDVKLSTTEVAQGLLSHLTHVLGYTLWPE